MSGIRLPDGSELAISQKNDSEVTICWNDIIIKFFCCCFVSLVKFSYCSKFHINIIAGSGVMKFGNTPVWVLPNIWRLGWVRDTKFGKDVFNEMLLNVAKCQGYSLYCFWVIKGRFRLIIQVNNLGSLAHLVSCFACNRVIVDASSNPLVSCLRLL